MTETKTHVILLSCGSFNPITRGHVHMFGEGGSAWGDQGSLHVYTSAVTCFSRTLTGSDSVSNVRAEKRLMLHQLTLERERALPRKHAQSHSNAHPSITRQEQTLDHNNRNNNRNNDGSSQLMPP